MVEKREEFLQVTAKHNGRSKKMTSSRRIEKQNADHQRRSGDPIQVDHDLLPVKQKVRNQEPFDDATDDVVKAFTITRFSRLQVLKGLAALSAVAMLPSLPSRDALAQTPPPATSELDRKRAHAAAYITWWLANEGDDPKEVITLLSLKWGSGNAATLLQEMNNTWRDFDQRERGEGWMHLMSGSFFDDFALGVKYYSESIVTDVPKAIPFLEQNYDKYVVPILGLTTIEADKQLAGLEARRRHQKDYTKELARQALEELLLNDQVDPEKILALDGRYETKLKMSARDIGKPDVTTFDTVIEESLPEKVRETVRQCKNSDGSISMTPEQYRAILKDVLGAIEEDITGIEVTQGILGEMMLATLRTAEKIDAQQKEILKWQADEDLRRLESVKHQAILEGANATVYLLSTIFSVAGNKELANQISTFGGAAVQFYQSYEKFTDTMSQLGKLAELTGKAVGLGQAMAGAAFTGNVVGIAMAIVPLLVDTGPTLEEAILQQVGVLSEQVNTLHKQMHERFDRIEQHLNEGFNAMYELTQKGLADVNWQLGELREDVDVIQEDLAKLAYNLDRMGQGLQTALRDGFRIDFYKACNIALNYRAKNQGEPMPRGEYIEWEGTIRTWANESAKGANEQYVADRSYADDDLLEELEKHPLEENIMYLSTWLEKSTNKDQLPVVRHRPFANKRLANPVTWATSAEVYARLRYENPEHSATDVFEGYNDMVEEVGQDLRYALRSIIVKEDTTSGPVPDKVLFRKLVENYKQKAKELDAALKTVESNYLSHWKTSLPNAVLPGLGRRADEPNLDPWSVVRQSDLGPVGFVLVNENVPQHDIAFPPGAPSNIRSLIPAHFLLADYMKLDNPALGLRIEPGFTEERQVLDRNYPPRWIQIYAKLQVTVTATYKDTPILARRVVGTQEMLIEEVRYNETGEDMYRFELDPKVPFEQHWTQGEKLKVRFESEGSQETLAPTMVHNVVRRVEGKLRELRVSICSETEKELGIGLSLDAPAVRLDGAKAVLDRFVNLGMPLALETDDFLRAMLYGAQSLMDRQQVTDRYSEAATLPVPMQSYVSLRSFKEPTKAIRHRNFLGELTEIQSKLDKEDSTFKIVQGLADGNAISLESLNFPGHFLVASEFESQARLMLKAFEDTSEYRACATFVMNPGLADPAGVTLSSKAIPDRELYVSHGIHGLASEVWVSMLKPDGQPMPIRFWGNVTFYITVENPRGFVQQDADARADALYKPVPVPIDPDPGATPIDPDQGATGVLADYLDLVGQKDSEGRWLYREFHPLLDSTIIKLQTTSAVAKVLNQANNGPPAPPIINGPTDGSSDTDGSITFFGTAEAGNTINLFEEGKAEAVGSATVDGSNAWSLTLSGVAPGLHSYTAEATNSSGLTSVASQLVKVTVGSQAPKVTSTVPASDATGVKRNTNLTATFSGKMNPTTLTKSTFQLFKVNADGSTTQITNVTVSKSTDGLKATLNPFGTSTTLLAKSTRYKAVVTAGAKDVAGTPLDQNPTTTGNQEKVWYFKTGLL